MSERKRVLYRSDSIDLYTLFDNATIEDAIAELQKLHTKVKYGQGEDARFRLQVYYDDTSVYLDIFRDENDTEYQARLEQEEKMRKARDKARETKKEKARQELYQKEEDERKEYERLKAKFG